MAHLSLTFLGTFQVRLDGKPVTAFRSSKVEGLLVYLALASQQPHGRDVLAALLWPEEPDGVAKKNLRQSLYQLRQVLGESESKEENHLLVTRSTIQFNPAGDHSLDVIDFLTYLEDEQLERAIGLYQGDLLPGFACDSLPFEDWLQAERERLHRLALSALFELAAQSLESADYPAAQEFARHQLALEPWREEAHRQLMEALALLGERSAALAQYETCRTLLQEELGVEPAVETKALADYIRNQERGSGTAAAVALPSERHQLMIPFVGRKSEHAALVKAYQQGSNGVLQVAILLGEAGIGKTRLAHNFLAWAATQGADILTGQAFETSSRLSYQPVTQALRQRLERENAPDDLLSDLWLTQLARILPELRDRYPDLPPPTQEEASARQHLFEAVARLGQALARRAPLVIFLDDWHWADAASLDVLHYASLRWSEDRVPILVLITLRQESLGENPDLATWLTRLKHDVACLQLDIAPLSGSETEQLVRNLIGSAIGDEIIPPYKEEELGQLRRFSHWLFKETEGQPFFLGEMLKALVEEGLFQQETHSPHWLVDWSKFDEQSLESGLRILPGAREIIRGWLTRISKPAGELLMAAAVLDQQASFDRLVSVAGLEEKQALTAIDELLARHLLQEAGEAGSMFDQEVVYHFSHHMLSEVIYSEAGAARRRLLHRRAFEALRADDAPSAELAHHALLAGRLADAIRYSLAAGNEAMRLLAVQVAISHYETAWQLVEGAGWPESISGADRQNLFANLGRAYELTEAWYQAQETYQAMIGYAQEIDAPAMQCLGLNLLATVQINGFKDPDQAIALLERARAVAEHSDDRRGLAETEANLSLASRAQQKTDLARHHGEQALIIARQLGHPQLMARCLNSLAYVYARLRQWNRVETYATEASQLYASAGNLILAADSQRVAGWSQMYSGRPENSLVTLQETLAFSQQIDNIWGEVESAWRLACTLLELGRYGEAIRMARQAVRQTRKVGQPTMVMLALTTWGAVQRTVMALESAQETLLEALAEQNEKNLTGFEDWVLAELCTVHALSGDWEQAQAYARRTAEFRQAEASLPMGLTGYYETEALFRGSDVELARADVERLGSIVGDQKRYRLPWLRSRAVLARWDGDPDQAITHLQSALKLAQGMGLPGEEWSILDSLARLYAGQGDRSEAQSAWTAAADIIRRLASTIEQEDLRSSYLQSEAIRAILKKGSEGGE
jgi:DNA-binding SARP family transcriptional activator/predicted ATPase